MSIDFSAWCPHCKQYIHLGQWMGGKCTFGYGSKDKAGREFAMQWIGEHCNTWPVQVGLTDTVPDNYVRVEYPPNGDDR